MITTSSPGANGTEPRTALVPVVTFDTKTRSSGLAPTNCATGTMASRSRETDSPWRRLLSVELPQHEPRGMPLHFVAERLLPVQHTSRDNTDSAVIEIGGCWIERPVLKHRAAEGHAAIIQGGTRRTA